ncbi:MAG: TIGR03118 family protein [Candidatus Binatia bacterium]
MIRRRQRRRSWIVPAGLLGLLALSAGCGDDNNNGGGNTFTATALVSDQAGKAPVTDARLVNAWGLARSGTGPWWVANNHTGTSTLYDGNGNPFPAGTPLIVTIPPPDGSPPGAEGAPTGLVFNATTDFVLTNGMPALFIFDTEDGTFIGWNLNSGSAAEIAKDDSDEGAIYKGLAIGKDGAASRLYATDFHNGRVGVYDGEFGDVDREGAFTDPNIPAGYAPFGIQNIGGNIYVTYAKQDENKEDDVPGSGNGYVDEYDGAGNLLRRFASRGQLNSPWGIVEAPASFGTFGGSLLIGNFGNGRINAFNPDTGAFQGSLSKMGGGPIEIEGVWGLGFGNGASAGNSDTLYFAAGPDDEANGLFGMITANN